MQTGGEGRASKCRPLRNAMESGIQYAVTDDGVNIAYYTIRAFRLLERRNRLWS